MRKIIVAGLFILLSSSVFAWTIGPMNYQGRLLDNAGVPVTGSYNFKVRIYDAASGGALKFSEQHNSVAVDDGVYSFLVSTGTNSTGAWDIALWNTPQLFLEIEVNGETLSPRHLMAAAPYAFQANLALTTNDALALGGKSAAEYDSTLEAICVSSKGKWLELVEKCLGIGASFPQQVEPAPPFVSWNALTASNDFSNLDLSRADISGISFAGANFSGTVFKNTTYYVGSFNDANLSDTVWENAVAVAGMYPEYVGPSTVLHGAVFKNMDMSQWKLSLVNQSGMVGLSAANLSGCPADLPSGWECRYDESSMYNSFLLGPGVNLSASSAAAISKFGSSYLNLGVEVLNNIDLTGASFEGNVVAQNFSNTTLTNVNFNYTTLRSNIFDTCDLTGATFVSSKFDKPTFKGTSWFTNANFTNAELSFVRFNVKGIDGDNFTNATLRQVIFSQDVRNSNFTNAVLDEVKMLTSTLNNIFDGTRFYHGFQHGGTVRDYSHHYGGGSTFNNLTFVGGTLSGDFTGATFTNINQDSFQNVTSSFGLFICGAIFPLQGGMVPGWSIGLGAACPDGDTYANCNFPPHMDPIPVAQCPAVL